MTLLSVENLSVAFGGRVVVRDVSFHVDPGETLALVGESGSGKSVTALSTLRLLPAAGANPSGRILLDGIDVLGADPAQLRALRGGTAGMVFQEPMTSLNPLHSIERQVGEAIALHQPGLSGTALRAQVLERLRHVALPNPEQRLGAYPHQLSGGQRQRVMIAAALANDPKLLIADEPTTALDVTIQAQILELLARLQKQTGMAMIFITHNLGVVAEIADRVMVMYGGRVVEQADLLPLFQSPRMPYTAGLMRSVPRLDLAGQRREPLFAIPGQVPDPRQPPPGCAFAPRCAHHRTDPCDNAVPPLEETGGGHLSRCFLWRELADALAAQGVP